MVQRNRFQNNVVNYRRRSGYTQVMLALYLGVSRSYLSDVETGKANPSLRMMEDLADALQVELWRLFI
ncbi:MAG: helix-turn-helix transcriptional regulator [Lachnospiraceae bacterium]|nr:helix-turn-helix transcriptional regulator [Lachnospiraceae bacterium]MDD3616585.1 helix-turn-helix transcriptional regulator [Lachnospiraceae bacterium]